MTTTTDEQQADLAACNKQLFDSWASSEASPSEVKDFASGEDAKKDPGKRKTPTPAVEIDDPSS